MTADADSDKREREGPRAVGLLISAELISLFDSHFLLF